MATANEAYQDLILRHRIALESYSAGEVAKVRSLLLAADRDIERQLRDRLGDMTGTVVSLRDRRLVALRNSMLEVRKQAFGDAREQVAAEMEDLAVAEAASEIRILEKSIPVAVGTSVPDSGRLRTIATRRPFQGLLLRDWFRSLEQADGRRLRQALQLGLLEGETTPQIVRRIVGTRAQNYRNGILNISRNQADAVVRTAISSVSNAARMEALEANSDIVLGYQWLSTLDGRTSAICRARDGRVVPLGENEIPDHPLLVPASARPPAHIRCRSTMVAVLDPKGILGNRPFVRDTRTASRRRVDFRAQARRTGRSESSIREEWGNKNIGRVPARTTYQQWLTRQPASFQDEVLGPTRGRAFRSGEYTLNQFVSREGKTLTLKELGLVDSDS